MQNFSLPASSHSARALSLGLVGLFAVAAASAKLPELDEVFFGTLRQPNGDPLVSLYNGQIAVSVRLNGVELSRTPIPLGASSYVAKVPKDDGVAPRLPGTVRAGEKVQVVLVNTQDNTEAEATESTATTGFPVDATKGGAKPQSLTSPVTLGSKTLAGYAKWKTGYVNNPNGLNANFDDSTADRDGDGRSNLAEFIANTDPLSSGSILAIKEMVHGNGVHSVRFGPVAVGRKYHLEQSTSLVGAWTRLTTFVPTAAADDQWLDAIDPGTTSVFYRVVVELQ